MHIAFKFKYTHDNGLFTRLLNRISQRSSLPLSLYREGPEYRVEASGEQAELEILADDISALVPRSLFLGEHAIEAIDVNASGYLLKPVRREALAEARANIGRVNKVQRMSVTGFDEAEEDIRSRTHISAKTRRGIELIPLSEVRFFQADHKYVTVRHDKGEVLIDDTLRDLEDEFGDRLVRIHRNALVMMDHLEALERDSTGHYQVRMRGVDQKLDVSRRHVSGLRRLVQAL